MSDPTKTDTADSAVAPAAPCSALRCLLLGEAEIIPDHRVEWFRGTMDTGDGSAMDGASVVTLVVGGRHVLTAVADGLGEAVSADDRRIIGEAISRFLEPNADVDARIPARKDYES